MVQVEEKYSQKFIRHFRQSPYLTTGLISLATLLGIESSIYRNQNVVLQTAGIMKVRAVAHGVLVGCIVLGIGHSMSTEFLLNTHRNDDD